MEADGGGTSRVLTPRIGLYGESLGAGRPEGERPLGVDWWGGKAYVVGEGVDAAVEYGVCLLGYSNGEEPLAFAG